MTEIESLLNDIEELRKTLLDVIEKSNWDLLDKEVLSASQNLNAAIVKYNKLLLEKNKEEKE
ncbi:MAG: Spo0E family sporulation regulatory protein-aspartic acid phosphatase [Clostridiales bacterium]|nr:Spo0E family sporulation regulatory protein-aspartic acid phosphatase [Clostridiales bacterium]